MDWQAREQAPVTPDHYATLGVEPNAPARVIRAAYLALMREYHPDRNPSPEATLRAQSVIESFRVLGDFDRRNHYDWDRRREREAAAAAAADGPRKNRASAMAAGALGLAALGAWMMLPTPSTDSKPVGAPIAEARQAPVVAPIRPAPRPKPVAIAPPVEPAVDEAAAMAEAEQSAAPIRVAVIEPVRPRPSPVTERPKPAAAPPPATRVATVVKAGSPRVAAVAKAPQPRVAAIAPPARPATTPTKRGEPASKSADLASLDQFVMNFYGQSWRYGDAPRRAALEQSRNSFIVRRGSCAADSCKRAAYLGLMRDVSEIVETGRPKAR